MSDQAEPEFVEVPSRTMNGLYGRLRALEAANVLMQDDLHRITLALDIGARPYSGHEAMERDILPAIAAKDERIRDLEAELAETKEVLATIERYRHSYAVELVGVRKERDALAAQNRKLREALAWFLRTRSDVYIGSLKVAYQLTVTLEQAELWETLLAAQPTPGTLRESRTVEPCIDPDNCDAADCPVHGERDSRTVEPPAENRVLRHAREARERVENGPPWMKASAARYGERAAEEQ